MQRHPVSTLVCAGKEAHSYQKGFIQWGAPNACGEVPQIALWLHHFLVQCSLELVACSEMSRAIHAKKNLGNAVALR